MYALRNQVISQLNHAYSVEKNNKITQNEILITNAQATAFERKSTATLQSTATNSALTSQDIQTASQSSNQAYQAAQDCVKLSNLDYVS